jgi:phage terminase large subunit GpA-like protein
VWNELEAEIHKPMVNAFGREIRLHAAAIDSRGHRTEQVKDFVMRTTHKVRIYAVQGSTSRIGHAIAQTGSNPTKTRTGKVIRHGYMVWNVGTEHCKNFIYGHLAADGERPEAERVFHFPQGLDDTYYDGVLSETYDPETKRYVQRLGARYKRNEPLDTLVYAWAIGHHTEIMIGKKRVRNAVGKIVFVDNPKYWERLALMLESGPARAPAQPEQAPPPQVIMENAPRPAPQRRKGSFVGGWRK